MRHVVPKDRALARSACELSTECDLAFLSKSWTKCRFSTDSGPSQCARRVHRDLAELGDAYQAAIMEPIYDSFLDSFPKPGLGQERPEVLQSVALLPTHAEFVDTTGKPYLAQDVDGLSLSKRAAAPTTSLGRRSACDIRGWRGVK